MFVQLLHGTAGKFCQIGIGGHGKEAAAGGFGKILQGFGVELADDMFSIRILPEPVFPAFIRNRSAGFRADADRNYQKPALFRFLGNFERGIHRVLTITEDDQRICPLRGAAFKVLHGFAEDSSEVGTACTRPTTVHLLQRIPQSRVVIGQRYDQVCLSGKDNEPDFVRRQCAD